MKYVNGVAEKDTGSAKYQLTVHGVPHLFGRKRHVMREPRNFPQPRRFALGITVGDFAFAMGHRRIAISFVAFTLKHPRWPPQILTRDPGQLNTVRW
jgi:hypothetical protein